MTIGNYLRTFKAYYKIFHPSECSSFQNTFFWMAQNLLASLLKNFPELICIGFPSTFLIPNTRMYLVHCVMSWSVWCKDRKDQIQSNRVGAHPGLKKTLVWNIRKWTSLHFCYRILSLWTLPLMKKIWGKKTKKGFICIIQFGHEHDMGSSKKSCLKGILESCGLPGAKTVFAMEN